jgi:hypothetical protein
MVCEDFRNSERQSFVKQSSIWMVLRDRGPQVKGLKNEAYLRMVRGVLELSLDVWRVLG